MTTTGDWQKVTADTERVWPSSSHPQESSVEEIKGKGAVTTWNPRKHERKTRARMSFIKQWQSAYYVPNVLPGAATSQKKIRQGSYHGSSGLVGETYKKISKHNRHWWCGVRGQGKLLRAGHIWTPSSLKGHFTMCWGEQMRKPGREWLLVPVQEKKKKTQVVL